MRKFVKLNFSNGGLTVIFIDQIESFSSSSPTASATIRFVNSGTVVVVETVDQVVAAITNA